MSKNEVSQKISTILFYDGDCGLCHWACEAVEKRDHLGLIYFAPLNGQHYQELLLAKHGVANLESLILFHEGKIFQRFEALHQAMQILYPRNYFLRFFKCLPKYLPNVIGDFLYNLVARNRKRATCSLRKFASKQFLD